MAIMDKQTHKLFDIDFREEILKIYDFKTNASRALSYDILLYAININRSSQVIKLSKYIDINIAIDLDDGSFEYALIRADEVAKQNKNNYSFDLIESSYHKIVDDIINNIDINDTRINNKTLLYSLTSGNLNAYYIPFLKPHQLHPQAWHNIITKKKLLEDINNNQQTTEIYKCYRCKNNKCRSSQIQARSGDEPMTIIVTCLVCYNIFTK